MEYEAFMKQAAAVVPSARQLAWYNVGFYGFIHFGVNTFTGRQWGLGNEPESVFNPRHLDCDEWVRTAKEAGMGGLILTAKHHGLLPVAVGLYRALGQKQSLPRRKGGRCAGAFGCLPPRRDQVWHLPLPLGPQLETVRYAGI